MRPSSGRVSAAAVGLLTVAIGAAAAGMLAIAHGGTRGETATIAVATIVAGCSFVAAGAFALVGRPEKRTAALMTLAGFLLLASSLQQSNRSPLFTIGLAVALAPAAVLGHLALGFPDGHLHSRWERLAIALAYADATVLQVTMLMFMGLENMQGCPCPSNLLLIKDDPTVHGLIMGSQRALSTALTGWILLLVVRRWWRASPPLRRAVTPLLSAAAVCTALFGLSLISGGISTRLTVGLHTAAQIVLAAVPAAYLFGVVQARLARGSVGDLMLQLERMDAPGRLRDALSHALGDPSLELAYWLPDRGGYVDAEGLPVMVADGPDRTVTMLERGGKRVAALLHDPALTQNRELLDAVAAAAGLTLENERLQAELRAQLDELRRLADEESALQRIATLVAQGVHEDDLAAAVAQQVGLVFGAQTTSVLRCDGTTVTLVGHWPDAAAMAAADAHLSDCRDAVTARVLETHAPARTDLPNGVPVVPGRAGSAESSSQRSIAAPIVVDGRLWGLITASRDRPRDALAARAEYRLTNFAALVAQAIANAESRDELRASRARIVEAGDQARRRLERNLHDGAQQRLVTLSVALSLAQEQLERDPTETGALLSAARSELASALEELRELARGLHPAILHRGLAPALQAVIERCPVPVTLEIAVPAEPPLNVAATGYYVVAEALTNIARYSRATAVAVRVRVAGAALYIEVTDDGVGNAAIAPGSGLEGLRDRVTAIEGSLELTSPAGGGTNISVVLPLQPGPVRA